jgi:hypothetical protein
MGRGALGIWLGVVLLLLPGCGPSGSRQPESEQAPAAAPAPASAPAAPASPAPARSDAAAAPPSAEAPAAGGLAGLRVYLDRYPRDVDLWSREPLAHRLHALLGPRFDAFVTNTQVQGPLKEEEGVFYVTGNKQYSGGTDAAALVIDPGDDVLWVWLMVDGRTEILQERDGVVVPLPADVRVTLQNAADSRGDDAGTPGD